MHLTRRQFLAVSSALAASANRTHAQPKGGPEPLDEVPFVVTPARAVERMLQMAELTAQDRLIDLGSGDGRIVIAAARRGARAVGLEIDPGLIAKSRALADAAGVGARTQFLTQDLFEANFSAFSVVTMYLLPEYNLKLRPKLLAQLKPGARVLSHEWDMGDWQPDETLTIAAPAKTLGLDRVHRLYLWIIPAQISGHWTITAPAIDAPVTFNFSQNLQKLTGTASRGEITALALRGTELTLMWRDGARHWRLVGQIAGNSIKGTMGSIAQEIGTQPWSATR
jgi:SAM-dependent methyltransferase